MLSDVDLKIVTALLRDARQSYRELGRRLGLSTATVAGHVRALERAGVIRGYRAEVDFEKLGYGFHVLVEVKVRHGRLFDVEKRMAADPHVYAVYDHTGGTDATAMARFRDRASLDAFIKRLQRVPHVERTETSLVLNIIKDAAGVLPEGAAPTGNRSARRASKK